MQDFIVLHDEDGEPVRFHDLIADMARLARVLGYRLEIIDGVDEDAPLSERFTLVKED